MKQNNSNNYYNQEQRVRRALRKTELLFQYCKNKVPEEILEHAFNYIKDAKYYLEQKDYFTAFGSIDYAYGLLEGALRTLKIEMPKDVR